MQELFKVLKLLPVAIIVKNLLGAGNGALLNKFDLSKLKRGLAKGIILYLAIGGISLMGVIDNSLMITLGDVDFTLVGGVVWIVRGAIALHLVDIFKLLEKLLKIKSTKEIE